jgi:hypothetical protein
LRHLVRLVGVLAQPRRRLVGMTGAPPTWHAAMAILAPID